MSLPAEYQASLRTATERVARDTDNSRDDSGQAPDDAPAEVSRLQQELKQAQLRIQQLEQAKASRPVVDLT